MYCSLVSVVLFCVVSLVYSVPLAALDSNTLLQNGLAAQALNAQFASVKASDPCNSGEVACISGNSAQCSTSGVWKIQSCPSDKQCFALPSVRQNGTFLSCTSEADALSTIAASGAAGGLVSNGAANATIRTASLNATQSSASPTTSSAYTLAEQAASTVTVTLTLTPGATLTLDPVTTIIPLASASSLFADILADGLFRMQPTAVSELGATPSPNGAVSIQASATSMC